MKFKQAYKRIPKQVKASAVILLSSFINGAMNFLTVPIFTRILSIEEYGLTAQYYSWLNIIAVFATLSLSAGVYHVAMNEYPEDRYGFSFSATILSNICTCVVFFFIFLFKDFFSAFFHLNEKLLLLMFINLLICPAMDMWLAMQRYEYHYQRVAAISIGSSVISQIGSLILVTVIKDTNLGVVKLFATQGILIFFAMFIYIGVARKSHWKPKISYIKFALLFNLPLLLHYLAQYVLRSTDKIMITHFIGEGATGIYSLAANVANISMIAWSAMSASLTPYVYSHISTNEYKKVNRSVIGVEALFAICCVGISFIGPEIVYILGSDKYMCGIYLIPPIAASCLLAAIYSFYSTIAFYYHKTTSTAVMTIIAATVNVILNYIFIPRYGYVAAAYTTEGAYLIYTLLHFLNYRRIVKENRIYNDWMIGGIVILATALCLLSGLLYQFYILRYLIILVGVVLLVIFGSKVFKMIKEN